MGGRHQPWGGRRVAWRVLAPTAAPRPPPTGAGSWCNFQVSPHPRAARIRQQRPSPLPPPQQGRLPAGGRGRAAPTCGRQRSSHCTRTCGCQRGRARHPLCRARTQNPWPGTAVGEGSRSVLLRGAPEATPAALPTLRAGSREPPGLDWAPTSQSSLMCLAKSVWVSVSEQPRRPVCASSRSWME